MLSFPIPIFVTCILWFVSFRIWSEHTGSWLLTILLALCGGQSLIIALTYHYGVSSFQSLMPITASFIPMLTWITFKGRFQRFDMFHLTGPTVAALVRFFFPQILDVLIPAIFLGYGVLIVLKSNDGPDAQPDTLLANGDLPMRIWFWIGLSLIASAFSDVFIVMAQIFGFAELMLLIISIFFALNLLLIGLLTSSRYIRTEQDVSQSDTVKINVPDEELWDTLQSYVTENRPHLDPDLTLSRLARKLGVPAKNLSIAINAATGENVSRYINKHRIAAAQEAMRAGESVTNAIYISGFNTKSNFNREFSRIVGKTPRDWLKTVRQ